VVVGFTFKLNFKLAVAEEQPELERGLELTVELKLQLKFVVGSFILKLKLKLAVVEEQPGLELTVELKRVVGSFILAGVGAGAAAQHAEPRK
jgi:hypothetical protein